MRRVLVFLAGVVFGALLFRAPIAEAAIDVMYGKFGNAAKAIQVDTNGNLKVVLN